MNIETKPTVLENSLMKNSIMLWGKKMGMTHLYDEETNRHIPITALWIPDNQIQNIAVSVKKILFTIGCVGSKNKLTVPLLGLFEKKNLRPYVQRGTFQADPQKNNDLLSLKEGAILDNTLLNIGDYIDIISTSKGKGFAGVVKKFGHRIKGRSNVSLAHRGHQSIGNRTDPGKVRKGTPMPGQMGDERRTTENLCVVAVDREKSIIFIKGSVAGGKGYVKIRSALKKKGCIS
jgi:large subunit ribosomal protein L3